MIKLVVRRALNARSVFEALSSVVDEIIDSAPVRDNRSMVFFLRLGETYGLLDLAHASINGTPADRRSQIQLFVNLWQNKIEWRSLAEMRTYIRQQNWRGQWYSLPGTLQTYDTFCFMQRVDNYLHKVEERKVKPFEWMSWKSHVLRTFRRGDMEATAWQLCCCLATDGDAVDYWGEKNIFSSPELTPHHAALWSLMVPLITPEFLGQVKRNLHHYGWGTI